MVSGSSNEGSGRGDVSDSFAPVESESGIYGGYRSITTREGWSAFVNTPQTVKPVMPSVKEFRNFSEKIRSDFASERIQYHLKLPPVEVPAMSLIKSQLLPLIMGNPMRTIPGAKLGGIVDGPGGVGKTTNITQLGSTFERTMRSKNPIRSIQTEGDYVPVVYVTLPSQTTVKGLNVALARFYGAVYSKRATTDEIGYAVIDHAERCSTSLIIIDDIHFLNLRSKDGRVVNDHLKFLANHINSTFIYAGIECEATGLLNEGHSAKNSRYSQMRRRFSLYSVTPFSLDTEDSTEEWKSLLRTLEGRLALVGGHAGMLSEKLYEYLFARTDGYIGAVSDLITRGAYEAIMNGEEKITKKTLSGITLDYASQQSSSQRLGSQSAVKKPKSQKNGSRKRTSAHSQTRTPDTSVTLSKVTRTA